MLENVHVIGQGHFVDVAGSGGRGSNIVPRGPGFWVDGHQLFLLSLDLSGLVFEAGELRFYLSVGQQYFYWF